VKVIVVSKRIGGSRSIKLGGWSGAFISVCLACLLGVPVATYLSYLKSSDADSSDLLSKDIVREWVASITEQGQAIDQLQSQDT